jgi:hypothetical protein
MRKKEQGVQKDVNEIRRKNKRLNKPLQVWMAAFVLASSLSPDGYTIIVCMVIA